MNKNKNYQKTERIIISTFLELAKRKDFNKISVSELCRLADINRATFYNHYLDIWEIPKKIEEGFIKEIDSILDKFSWNKFINDPSYIFIEIQEALIKNKSMYQTLLSIDQVKLFLINFTNLLENKILSCKDFPKEIKQSDAGRIRIFFFSGGMANIYIKWLLDDNIDIKSITRELSQLFLNDISNKSKII